MDERQRAPGRPCKALCLRDPLSYMERAVMGGIRLGLTSKAMAHKLGICEGSVKRIKARAYRKLKAKNAIDAVFRYFAPDCVQDWESG